MSVPPGAGWLVLSGIFTAIVAYFLFNAIENDRAVLVNLRMPCAAAVAVLVLGGTAVHVWRRRRST